MRTTIYLATILVIFSASINALEAQSAIEWQKCYGGSGTETGDEILQTSDGGYILAGYASSTDGDVTGNHGLFDFWIVKTDEAGTIQWQKSFGGSNWDYAFSIAQTSDGGYIVAGETESNDGDVSGNHGGTDMWVIKLDEAGILQWQKCLGGSGGEVAYSVCQTSDGGYVVAGYTWFSNDGNVSGNHGDMDMWVVKLGPDGNFAWQKCLGGSDRETAYSVIEANDGGIVVAGRASSNDGDVSENHGDFDVWTVKLDLAGNIQWQKCFGGSAPEFALAITATADNGFILTGPTSSFDGDVTGNHSLPGPYGDAWVVKTDAAGNLSWQKCLGGSWDDWGFDVWQTSDNGFLVGCITKSHDQDVSFNHDTSGNTYDYWIVKLDTNRVIQWEESLGGSDIEEIGSVMQTADGGYVAQGRSFSNDGDVSGNHGAGDYWIAKLSLRTSTVEPTGSLIRIYPNPTTALLTVVLPEEANISLATVTGTRVCSRVASIGTNQMDLSSLTNGIYILHIRSDKESISYKIIKE